MAWGEETVYKTALFGPTYNSQGVSSYTATWAATNSGFTVSLANFNNNNNEWNFVKCGRKNNASVATITTSAAIDKAVSKVAVTIDAITASKVNSIKLYTSTDNSTWTEAGSFEKGTGTKEVSLSTPTANCYYKVEFDCASGSSNGLVTVSKVEYYINEGGSTTEKVATPTFTPAAGVYTSAPSVEISSATDGATVYYTTDGTEPTTSSSVYGSAIIVSETTTIKAIAVKAGLDNSTVATATYAILDHAGTAEDPYTVADARNAIDANTGVTNVYATGIVSEIVTAYNNQFGNISYNISVDGTTTSDQLQAYRGKSYNGADFTSEDDIQVGDEVVVYGTLKKYEDTYEFEAGNQLVSLKRKKSDATILVGDASVVYGTTFTIDTEVIKGGEITVTSGNTAIATVSGLTITPVAVGSVEITVTTAENDYYKAGSETFTLTITQPEGQTTASTGSEGGIVFYESFAGSTGSITTFSNTDGNGEIKYDNDGWLVTNAYGADDAAKFGSSKKTGSAETPNITGTIGATYTMTFKAAPWASEETTMKVSATGATISGISETSMTTGQWNEFTATVTPTATTFSVTFEASKNRFFLDEVKIEAPAASAPAITAKLNASGYATYCNQYPLSFANNENVTAWALTGIEKDGDGTYKMNYTQITGAVKGGVGMLLKGEANDEVEIESKNSEDTPTTNLFVGTLAPTYVEAGAVYGLSGSTFKKSASNGTVKANKAYIPASELPADAKSFIFVFENETTGIRTMETHSAEEVKAIFNIAGQRLQNMQKGINIVGGKKILVK